MESQIAFLYPLSLHTMSLMSTHGEQMTIVCIDSERKLIALSCLDFNSQRMDEIYIYSSTIRMVLEYF